jgi:hypothetical protein
MLDPASGVVLFRIVVGPAKDAALLVPLKLVVHSTRI